MSAAQRDEQGDTQGTAQADTQAGTQAVAPPPARRLVAVIALVPVIAALALWAFARPAARIAPRDLPVGVAGPAAARTPSAAVRGAGRHLPTYTATTMRPQPVRRSRTGSYTWP